MIEPNVSNLIFSVNFDTTIIGFENVIINPIFFYCNEKISNVTNGKLFINIENLYNTSLLENFLNKWVVVNRGKDFFCKLYITSIEAYYGSIINTRKDSFTIILALQDCLNPLLFQFHSRCFNNQSPLNIIKSILMGQNINPMYSISNIVNQSSIPLKIQYQENDWVFLQRIMGEYGILSYWQLGLLHFTDNKNNLPSIFISKNDFIIPEKSNFKRVSIPFLYYTNNFSYLEEISYNYKQISNIKNLTNTIVQRNNNRNVKGFKKIYNNNSQTKINNFLINNSYVEYITRNHNSRTGYKFDLIIDNKKKSFIIKETHHFIMMANTSSNENSFIDFIWKNLDLSEKKKIFHLLVSENSYYNIITTIEQDITDNFFIGEIIPKPIAKMQNAIVCSSTIKEYESNQYGDILIKFLWDNSSIGNLNNNNVCWSRRCNLFTGEKYGINIIPRVGEEVLVDFLNNDIDYPIVLGSLTNNINKPYYGDAVNKLSIKTNSLNQNISGERFNELTFDDNNKDELIYLRGQKDFKIDVMDGNLDINLHAANNQSVINSVTISNGDMLIKLEKGNYNTNIKGDCNFDISGNVTWNVSKDFIIKAANFTTDITNNIDQSAKILTHNIASKINQNSKKISIIANSTMEIAGSGSIDLKSLGSIEVNSSFFDLKTITGNIKATANLTIKSNSVLTIQAMVLLTLKSGILISMSSLMMTIAISSISAVTTAIGGLKGFPPWFP